MRRGWAYVLTGVVFAGICAWISYNDGLFVARLAGNHDTLAYFYPLLPDGLIVLCLLALAEAARAGAPRSRWAVAGLLLGIGLTLAMNTYAGVEHSPLDAVLDGMVPVVFFIAAEVVLWHVRRGRAPAPVAASVAAPVKRKLPPLREIQDRQNCGQETARKIRAEVALDRSRGNAPILAPAPAAQDPAVSQPDTDSRAAAGNGRGASLGDGAPATQAPLAAVPPVAARGLNGQAHGS